MKIIIKDNKVKVKGPFIEILFALVSTIDKVSKEKGMTMEDVFDAYKQANSHK